MGNFADKRILATEEMVGATHATKTDTLNRLALISLANTGFLAALPGLLRRSKFRWKDADEIYIGPGAYHLDGTDEIIVQWSSELTFQFQNLGASDWSYLYIDDSAVQTAATHVLTASEFIDSTTEPAWSDTKHGWYNGNDRCIFAVLTSGASAILEFFHDGGDLVVLADQITSMAATDLADETWTDVTVAAPKFSTRILLTVMVDQVDGSASYYWRTNGQTGTTGHLIGGTHSGAVALDPYVQFQAFSDASQVVEVMKNETGANANTITVITDGWFFPTGT